MLSGVFGERQAEAWLIRKGGKLLDRNYRSRFGEIDLIVELDGYLLFVEVKTRSKNAAAQPRESVNIAKRKKIAKTALQYLSETVCRLQPRFDVIEVIIPAKDRFYPYKIRQIENAFDMGGLVEAF